MKGAIVGKEPIRGMVYKPKHVGNLDVQVIRVFPWGRGHRIQYFFVMDSEERRECSLSSFLSHYIKK